VLKLELAEAQLERTVKDKITYNAHLEYENYCFELIFEILFKLPIQWHKKDYKIW